MKKRDPVTQLIKMALAEDVGRGDLTTSAMSLAGIQGEAFVLAKTSGIFAGRQACTDVFKLLDKTMRVRWHVREGQPFAKGDSLAILRGDTAAILTGERTGLNFLTHLSGIATHTRRFVEAITGTNAQVLDTRKTTPGLRLLEKAAVKAGGGVNHRLGLDDAVMVKNNHIAACGAIAEALERVTTAFQRRKKKPLIICEVRTLSEVRTGLEFQIPWLLLDHFSPAQLRRVVALVREFRKVHRTKVILESSGGVTLRNIRARAEAGVDYISIGAITQAAPPVDLSLRIR